MDSVLKSWAVPKEPPTKSGVKRLAVQVEDHALDYINFEGRIPEGMYGAGTVEIWDKGIYTLRTRTENKIEFTLQGSKLKGDYVLIRFNVFIFICKSFFTSSVSLALNNLIYSQRPSGIVQCP